MDTNTIAKIIVLLFGVAVCVISLWAMFVPERLRMLVHTNTYQTWGYYVAVTVRVSVYRVWLVIALVFGLFLIYGAAQTFELSR